MDEVARLVQARMHAKKMTIIVLAARTGVSRHIIGRWLNGGPSIKLKHLLPIMHELGLYVAIRGDTDGKGTGLARRS